MKSFALHMRKHLLFAGIWFFVTGWYLPHLMSKVRSDAWTQPSNYMIVAWGVVFMLASIPGFRLHKQNQAKLQESAQ